MASGKDGVETGTHAARFGIDRRSRGLEERPSYLILKKTQELPFDCKRLSFDIYPLRLCHYSDT